MHPPIAHPAFPVTRVHIPWVLLLLWAALAPPGRAQTASPQPRVQPADVRVDAGRPFLLPIYLHDAHIPPISAYRLTLRYDPTHLAATDVLIKGTRSEGALALASLEETGLVHVAAAAAEPLGADSLLLLVAFTPTGQEGTTHIVAERAQLDERVYDTIGGVGAVDMTATARPGDTLRIAIPNIETPAGQSFTVTPAADGPPLSIVSLDFEIAYDARLVRMTGSSVASMAFGAAGVLFDLSTGPAGFAQGRMASAQPVALAGSLFALHFDVIADSGDTEIAFTRVRLDDGAAAARLDAGTVRILPAWRPGDLTGDGVIGHSDASLLMDALAGAATLTEAQRAAADVSGNGALSAYDVALILQVVAGVRTCFPVEPGCAAGKDPSQSTAPFALTLRLPEHQHAVLAGVATDWPDGWLTRRYTHAGHAILAVAGATPPDDAARETIFRLAARMPGSELRLNDEVVAIHTSPRPAHDLLLAGYPNPFSSTVVVPFTLAAEGKVELVVYDAIGRVVAVPFRGWMAAGSHTMPVTLAGAASGVYHFVLRTERSHLSTTAIKR